MKYYAAYNLDEYLHLYVFKNRSSGFFVDIGAHDGISINNTFFFEQLGWDGICFEPIPSVFENLKKNRKCKCINKAIYTDNSKHSFFKIDGYSEMLSGLVSEFQQNHVVRINKEIEEHYQNFEYIDVECGTVTEEIQNVNINLLSIDTEGSEYSILKTVDFTKYNIEIIVLELNYRNDEFIQFLNNNGFDVIHHSGVDIVLKNRNYVYKI